MTYRVGEPDPTPGDGAPCEAPGPMITACTWHTGHQGDHVAGDGSEIVAVWPQVAEDFRTIFRGEFDELRVAIFRGDDGALVIMVDPTVDERHVRVYLNDGELFDGDPDSDEAVTL